MPPGPDLGHGDVELRGRRVLFIVENLPVPFDRRIWQEATTLARHGVRVTVICPVGKFCEAPSEEIDGVRVSFELDPAGTELCELRLALRLDDQQVSETWLYRWTKA